MKFACTRRDARAADRVALETARLDQRARARALVGVLEDRPERARLARLARRCAALQLAHTRADLVAHAGLEAQDGLGDDLRAANVRVPVAQLERVGPAAARSRRRNDVGRAQHVADLAAVRAGVHAHGAADGARDRAAELDARERRPRCAPHDGRQRRTAAAAHGGPSISMPRARPRAAARGRRSPRRRRAGSSRAR